MWLREANTTGNSKLEYGPSIAPDKDKQRWFRTGDAVTVLDKNRHLFDLGFSLLNLGVRSKRPIERAWNKLPKKTWSDLTRQHHPGMNIGIRLDETTRIGGAYVAVLDCDVKSEDSKHREEMEEALRKLLPDYATYPTTWSGRGNGSRHIIGLSSEPLNRKLIIRSNETVEVTDGLTKKPKACWEIMLLGLGSQVVAPGSIHPETGKEYLASPAITSTADLKFFSFRSLALRVPTKMDHRVPDINFELGAEDLDKFDLPKWVAEQIISGEGVDNRSDSLFGVAIAMYKAGMTTEQVGSILTDRATYLGEVPFERVRSDDRDRAFSWLYRYTLKKAHDVALGVTAFEPVVDSLQRDTRIICLADVEPEKIEWLWYPYLPLGKLTMIEGDPGLGKSWATLAIATHVTHGRGLPDCSPADPGNVLLLSCEDGLGDTIKPRLLSMGADDSRVFAPPEVFTFTGDGLGILENFISIKAPKLVVIDPLVAYFGANVDINRANETRSLLSKLGDIAARHKCALLMLRHLTKQSTSKSVYRGIGSIDFTAACRSVLLVGSDPNNRNCRAIIHIKSNLSAAGPSQGYTLDEGKFSWTGESSLTAVEVLGDEKPRSAVETAKEFLRRELANGEQEQERLREKAEASGISESSLNRAKRALRVLSERKGITGGGRGEGEWYWKIPADAEPAEVTDLDDQT